MSTVSVQEWFLSRCCEVYIGQGLWSCMRRVECRVLNIKESRVYPYQQDCESKDRYTQTLEHYWHIN